MFEVLKSVCRNLGLEELERKFEDGAEIARIVRYYASEVSSLIFESARFLELTLFICLL